MWAEEVVAERIGVLERQLDWLDRKPEPEAIHQVRVATRRLRAALRHLGPCLHGSAARKLRRESGRLARALGELRDLDILMLNISQEKPDARSPLAKLVKNLEKRRAARLHRATPEARMLRQHLPDYRRKLMS